MSIERVAVVSGAASGIAAATARLLAGRGWSVVGVDIDPAVRDDTALHAAVVGDVSSIDTWDSVADAVAILGPHQHLGLVLGVGRAVIKPSRELTAEDWRQSLDVNLFSAFHGAIRLLPLLEAASSATVVTVGSLASRFGNKVAPAYSAAKGALEAWTRAFAVEMAATSVAVNCVLPGVVDTEGLRNNLPAKGETLEELAHRARQQPRGRLLTAQEVAEVVAFVVSPESSALLGGSVVVDGGQSAWLTT